jgi:hypothetical protein
MVFHKNEVLKALKKVKQAAGRLNNLPKAFVAVYSDIDVSYADVVEAIRTFRAANSIPQETSLDEWSGYTVYCKDDMLKAIEKAITLTKERQV